MHLGDFARLITGNLGPFCELGLLIFLDHGSFIRRCEFYVRDRSSARSGRHDTRCRA